MSFTTTYYKLHQTGTTLLPNEMSAAKCRGDGGTRTLVQAMWTRFMHTHDRIVKLLNQCWQLHICLPMSALSNKHLPQSNVQVGSSIIQSNSMISNLRKFPEPTYCPKALGPYQSRNCPAETAGSWHYDNRLRRVVSHLWPPEAIGGSVSTQLPGQVVSGCLCLALGASKVSASCTCQQKDGEKSCGKTHAAIKKGHIKTLKVKINGK